MDLAIKITKQFSNFQLDADFRIQGDKIGVFGPSGGGKSTLVSMIAGLRHPDKGSIHLDGQPLFDSNRGIHIPVEHRRIGMVFQKAHLFPHLSVKNNLLYGYKRCEAKDRQITFDSVVDVMQLKHLLGRGIKNLSGGEKQRVAIGRAVLSNPKLLLMDEPLSAVDENLKFQIMTYLKDTCDVFRIPYFFISHSLLEMRVMTDTVLTMANGVVTGQITTENLARDTMIVENRYVNLLRLSAPKPIHDIYAYRWGDQELFVSSRSDLNETLFELASTDIILFKRHPEAVSARNLLKARVSKLLHRGAVVGVELKCGSEVMVSEITRRALDELQISEGSEVYAAIKAVAFRKLG